MTQVEIYNRNNNVELLLRRFNDQSVNYVPNAERMVMANTILYSNEHVFYNEDMSDDLKDRFFDHRIRIFTEHQQVVGQLVAIAIDVINANRAIYGAERWGWPQFERIAKANSTTHPQTMDGMLFAMYTYMINHNMTGLVNIRRV